MGNLDTVYYSSRGPSKVTDCNIGVAVRWGATYDGLLLKGYTLNRISSHSLRAGGAMALKLAGAPDSTIMQVGWWTLLTYLTYTHTNWCIDGRFSMEDEHSVHIPKCWLKLRLPIQQRAACILSVTRPTE